MNIPNQYLATYTEHVSKLEARLAVDEALRQAIGGEFVAVGKLEYYLLRSLGLSDSHLVVDVGCGSGRLATQLAPFPGIRYIGCDIVPRLLDYAKDLCRRSDWTFVPTSGVSIPCADSKADFVVFFSVFTHLMHEDTFLYIRDAYRALRPGGTLVFSFIEFRIPCHWDIFIASVAAERGARHLDQFLDRDGISAWAKHSGFDVVSIHDGDRGHIPIPEDVVWENGNKMSGLGNLGQSVAILRKPE